MTAMSNPALWATSTSCSGELPQRREVVGPAGRIRHHLPGVMPWMRMFHSEKSLCGNGGRMYQCSRSTTRPSRTFTRPTEQADAPTELAVSKSIAVKSTGTRASSHGGSDTAPGASSGASRSAANG